MSSVTDSTNTSVAGVFSSLGIPDSVWEPIETVESGGNPYTKNMGTAANPEYSIGLFQLNKDGGLGAAYSEADLYNSVTNATIAGNAMLPAYRQGVAQGLTGLDLTRYVAYNSGWPTMQGVGALQSDPVVQDYDPKLAAAYGSPDISADTGVFKSAKDAVTGVTSGNYAPGIVLILIGLIGFYSFTKVFS